MNDQPDAFSRRVLVCLSGLTPQVITETLYALLTSAQPFVPTELHVVTTTEGARRAVALLQGTPQRPGALAELWHDYAPKGAALSFDPGQQVHLISEGKLELPDVTQAGHHVSTADSILSTLRPLLTDRHSAVHASLAGGRKSMSFYMGYVMSLLARDQDRLSHVLVNAPFDTLPDFSHPPRVPVELEAPDGSKVSTASARVGLSEIAFVKISRHLPKQLLSGQHNFESLVRQAQAALEGMRVVLDVERRVVAITSGGAQAARVLLSPQEFGLYAYLAQRRLRSGQLDDERADEGLVALVDEAKSAQPLAASAWLDRLEGSLELRAGQLRRDWEVDTAVRERVSSVNSKLEAAMAAGLSARVRILGPGDRGVRDGRYGLLGVAPMDVHFGNA